jgi:hypothetical protein
MEAGRGHWLVSFREITSWRGIDQTALAEIMMGKVVRENLNDEEFASLMQVGNGLSQNTIPEEHRKRLIELRLVKEELGNLRQTPHGIFIARPKSDNLVGMPPWRRDRWRKIEAQSQQQRTSVVRSIPQIGGAGCERLNQMQIGGAAVMELHKFKFGQSVEFVASDLRLKPLGLFKIVRVMPSERGIRQYRIQSVMDGHERVVMEGDLTWVTLCRQENLCL